ncbi:hypothetical protein FAIPA1_60137 [Frankia sp. AiPs1]
MWRRWVSASARAPRSRGVTAATLVRPLTVPPTIDRCGPRAPPGPPARESDDRRLAYPHAKVTNTLL